MRIIRQKAFSSQKVLEDVSYRLDKDGIRDYEITYSVPHDCISITPDLNNTVIYLPYDFEYSQFGIDAFIRSMLPYARTTTTMDRNIYIMKVFGRLTEPQFIKLVKYIINDSGFCVIINK